MSEGEIQVRKRRTPAEILADLQAKVARAQARVAMSEAESTGPVAFVARAMNQIMDAAKAANRGLSEKAAPAVSFAIRRASHAAWVEEIDAAERLALAQVSYSELVKPVYQGLITETVTRMQGSDSEDEVQEWAEAQLRERLDTEEIQEAFSIMQNAEGAYQEAHEARKALIASKKG